MAARAMWKADLALGELKVPVKLYAAVQDAKVHFRLLHAAERLKCRTVIPRQLHFLEPHSLPSGLFAAIDTP